MAHQSHSRLRLPGFGLPLNHERNDMFPNALSPANIGDGKIALPLTTVREFSMLRLMNQITDKLGWEKKILDDSICTKWKNEALKAAEESDLDITECMMEWCIDELRYQAESIEEHGGAVVVYRGDVVKSDVAIPTSLRQDLIAAVKTLEDVPARHQDWHPDSDGKVLDLVHPSLFPLVYGRSRILKDCLVGLDDCLQRSGQGDVIPVPPESEATFPMHRFPERSIGRGDQSKPYSTKFQWLPCDVEFTGEGASKIVSYINNLHPVQHRSLYGIIEKIIDKTIPLWSMTLAPVKYRAWRNLRIMYDCCEYDPDPDDFLDSEKPAQEDGEDEYQYWERLDEWCQETRVVVRPEPGKFKPDEEPEPVDLKKEYPKGLQIIVKLANIHLTPENPNYEGGTWHVEGQLNEHICATALYYYDNENITESRLSFRQQSDSNTDDINYLQNHAEWLDVIYGCTRDGPAVQEVGDVVAREGRLLTFPNILQHRVKPFSLADKTKPGHRKIVALFLVDPHMRIISTANIPCQQHHWWAREAIKEGPLVDMPAELQIEIAKHAGNWPVGVEEAKELRLELMQERKAFVLDHGAVFEAEEISLCEH